MHSAPLPRALLAPFLIFALAVACSDSTEPRVPTTLQLDQVVLQLEMGESVTVNAEIVDQNGSAFVQEPDGYEIEWSVDDAEVATVDGGTIAGVGPGSATVTARAGDLSPVSVIVEVLREPVELSGEMSFEYAGDLSGTFDVSAEFVLDSQGRIQGAEWALAVYDVGFGSQDLVGQREAEGGGYDLLWIWVEGDPVTEEGSWELDDGFILFGVSDPWLEVDEQSTVEAVYLVDQGQLTVTSVTEERMAGAFAFTGHDGEEGVLEVTDGTFDAPSLQLGSAAESAAAVAPAPFATGGGSTQGRITLSRTLLLDWARSGRTLSFH